VLYNIFKQTNKKTSVAHVFVCVVILLKQSLAIWMILCQSIFFFSQILVLQMKNIITLYQSYHACIFSLPQLPKSYQNMNTDCYFSKTLKINFKTEHPRPPRFVCLNRYFFYFPEFYWLRDAQAEGDISCS